MVATLCIQNTTDLRLPSMAANMYREDLGGAVPTESHSGEEPPSPAESDAPGTAERMALAQPREVSKGPSVSCENSRATSCKTLKFQNSRLIAFRM